jgi:predicted RND superfamily exporter protein
MVAAYEFVETRLGGAGAWDLIVPVPHPLDESTVAKVRRLQERLRAEVAVADESGTARPGLTKVLSVVDVLDATRESVEIVNLLPFLRRKYTVEGHLKLLDGQLPGILETMLAEDSSQPGRHYLRIMLRSQERQPASSKTELIREAVRIAREEIPQAEAAGSFVMLTALVESIARDQWLTFGVATVGIGLLLFAAYRRLTWALVGLVPNVLPVFMVTGVLGWLGLKMNMGAAMIAAVSMGMSVDSSVHYFSAYQRARSEGLAPFEAIRRVHQLTGRAMVFSTLALVAGFSTLATSDFVPTIYFGALMGLTMIGGLAGNLVMLPVLLAVVDGRRKSVPAEATGPILGDRPR